MDGCGIHGVVYGSVIVCTALVPFPVIDMDRNNEISIFQREESGTLYHISVGGNV